MPRSLAAGSDIQPLDQWQPGRHQPLGTNDVHVWRIRLDAGRASELWPLLSRDEQNRASRFHFEEHRDAYVVAHGMLRRILAGYCDDQSAQRLVFTVGEYGKPALQHSTLEFNLSHSGDYALLAVSRGGPVGVDIERWNSEIEHLDLSERFFSPAERRALRTLGAESEQLVAGFFAAWSRKEAYLKARGDGVAHGLDHFDVTLEPSVTARLIEDRTDATALDRWVMHALDASLGYSAALVAAAPVEDILLCDAE